MYCKYCGFALRDTASFCDRCGKAVVENTPVVVTDNCNSSELRESAKSVYDSKVLLRRDYRKSIKASFVLNLILVLVIAVVEICYLTSSSNMIETEIARKLLTWFLIFDGIVIIILMIKIYNLSKIFVCVTDKGVFGVGSPTSSLMRTKAFAALYSDITRVYGDVGIIAIECGGEKYVCSIKKGIATVGMVKKSIIKFYRDNSEYVWICSKCGSVNRYVGSMCNACMSKRNTKSPEAAAQELVKDIEIIISRCKNKNDFVLGLAMFGYKVDWKDSAEKIIFVCPDGTVLEDKDVSNAKYHKSNLELLLCK